MSTAPAASPYDPESASSGEDPNQPLIDAIKADQDAHERLTAQIAAFGLELADWKATVNGIQTITTSQAVKALSDIISGQIAGVGYAGRSNTASAGQTVRY